MVSPIALNLSNFQVSEPIWQRPARRALEDPFFYKAANLWSEDEVLFLTSATDLNDDTGWRPIRPLGKGGYGMVGLWQKLDDKDAVLDSLAIKQQRYKDPQTQARLTLGTNGLSYEAALMDQLNEQQTRNIIRLRGFKDNRQEELWRFYFEFAPWGDLRLLKNNYRAWNTYFPEEFLWHVFHGLATAALALAGGEFWDFTSGEIYETGKAFVIHFDLKPENIVLGDPVDEMPSHFSNYPVVKMADFGLAQLVVWDDPQNPKYYRGLGTPGYYPPVRLLDIILWGTDVDYA